MLKTRTLTRKALCTVEHTPTKPPRAQFDPKKNYRKIYPNEKGFKSRRAGHPDQTSILAYHVGRPQDRKNRVQVHPEGGKDRVQLRWPGGGRSRKKTPRGKEGGKNADSWSATSYLVAFLSEDTSGLKNRVAKSGTTCKELSVNQSINR